MASGAKTPANSYGTNNFNFFTTLSLSLWLYLCLSRSLFPSGCWSFSSPLVLVLCLILQMEKYALDEIFFNTFVGQVSLIN